MDASLISPDMVALGPDILKLIEIEIQSRKITYQQLAAKVHIANGTVGSWFSRGAIPVDKVWSVVAAVGSAKLWMQVLSLIPGNAFSTRYLDKTDEHPLALLDEAIEVAEAFLENAKAAKRVIRHRQVSQFDDHEENTLARMEDSIAECINIGQMVLVRFEECFERPARLTMHRHSLKMRERGYYSHIKEKTAPMRAAN